MAGLRGSPRRKPDGTLMTETLRRDLLRDYLEGGMSQDQIAAKYGVSMSYAPTMAKRRGVDRQMDPWMVEAVLFEKMPPPPPKEIQQGAPREDKPRVSGECPEALPIARKSERAAPANSGKKPYSDTAQVRGRPRKAAVPIEKYKALADEAPAAPVVDEQLQAQRIRRYAERGIGTTRIAALLRVPYKVVQEALDMTLTKKPVTFDFSCDRCPDGSEGYRTGELPHGWSQFHMQRTDAEDPLNQMDPNMRSAHLCPSCTMQFWRVVEEFMA